jgi:hypothetical protein
LANVNNNGHEDINTSQQVDMNQYHKGQ